MKERAKKITELVEILYEEYLEFQIPFSPALRWYLFPTLAGCRKFIEKLNHLEFGLGVTRYSGRVGVRHQTEKGFKWKST